MPALGLLCACGGDAPATDAAPAPGPEADAAVVLVPAVRSDPAATRPYPPEIRTVRLRQSGTVRVAPSDQAAKLGTVAAHSRVLFRGSAPTGNGCRQRWIELEPSGWICEELLEPSKLWPEGIEMPRLDRGELVPGVYGKVFGASVRTFTLVNGKLQPGRELAGSTHLRRYGEVVIDAPQPAPPAGAPAPAPGGSRSYWNIGKNEVVPADQISLHEPSAFRGVRLGDESGMTMPVGFVFEPASPMRAIWATSSPTGGRAVRRLPGRSAHSVAEIARAADGKPTAYRIGAGEWVPARQMRLAEAAPPPDRTLPQERWVDVDLDRQILVAYEGVTPVYATLVSTGNKRWPTATGIYRNFIKFAETDMSGQMADEAPYQVATVPWTQFFAKDLALHTSYWHDGFGTQRSHGCVNLSPVDSRFLYFWSDPPVPPGWSMAHGHIQRPGSMVRIRSAADPNPEFKGYAREVWAARGP